MQTDTQIKLAQLLPDFPFQWNYPLATMTYFKVGGPAEAYIELDQIEQVQQLRKVCLENDIPLTLLAGASNVIVSDEGIDGVVLHLTNNQVVVDGTKVTAGAGVKTALLVKKTVDNGLAGLEYFLGVPGNLGGATYNNAHYLQHLIGEHITRVQVITPDNQIVWLSHQECAFGYDTSRFHTSGEIIMTVEFELKPGDKNASLELIKEATIYRAQTQPLGEPSSGCIFQNVPMNQQLAALFPQFADRSHIGGGFLIDQAGLKGTKVGDIEVSHKHAAFFVNKGSGTASQALELLDIVKKTVKEKFGVELQPEVFFLGKKTQLNTLASIKR